MRQIQFIKKDFFENDIEWKIKSHEKFQKKLNEEVLTERHRKMLLMSLVDDSLKLIIEKYTIGSSFDEIKPLSDILIEDCIRYINQSSNTDFMGSGTLEGYINCLWILSFCYFFNVPREQVQIIADHISLTGKDMLIDRLIAASIPGHPIAVGQLAFPDVYKPLTDALSFNQTTEERNEKVLTFLKNYYPLLKKHQVGWHDSHKVDDPDYCYHFGYWIFELAALAADISWDDTAYRDHIMYPKDLVDWKFAQREKEDQIKI